jgi:hypothetical protein
MQQGKGEKHILIGQGVRRLIGERTEYIGGATNGNVCHH